MKHLIILGIIFSISFLRAAQNDNFADTATLSGTAGKIAFDLENTTVEPGEDFSRGSIWYHWTAPSSGRLTLKTTPAFEGISFRASAYKGNSLTTLTPFGTIYSNSDFQEFSKVTDPGEVIMIRIGKDTLTAQSNEGTLEYKFIEGPTHDSRLTPIDLGSVMTVDFNPDNSTATRHPDEWLGNQSFNSGTLWYEWIAPENGLLYIHAASETFLYDARVNLHSGDGGGEDRPVISVTGRLPSSNRFPVTAGKRYLLSYSTSERQRSGPAKITLRLLPIDPSYQFTNAISIPSENSFQLSGSLRSAPIDNSVIYDDLHEPWQDPPSASIWYSWQAPMSGPYQAKRSWSNTRFAIWQETGGGTLELIAQDTSGTSEFEAVAGQNYLISILNLQDPTILASSYFRWQLISGAPPTNDNFANRQLIQNDEIWEIEASNTFATSEIDEPMRDDLEAQRSLWYSWTAPESGLYLLDVPQSDYRAKLDIYTGTTLPGLNPIASGEQRVIFAAVKEVTYQIALDAIGNRSGSAILTLEPARPPANDDFASRIVLPGTRPRFNDYLRYATLERGEPGSVYANANASVWYEFTSISSTSLYFRSGLGSVFQTSVVDPTLTDLTEVPNLSGSIPVLPFETYYIRLLATGRSDDFPLFFNTANSDSFSSKTISPNTSFGNRHILPSLRALRTGTTSTGMERQFLNDSSIQGQYTAWWSWTAPESGIYQLTRADRSYGSVAIFTGNIFSDLTEVSHGSSESHFFQAQSGTTYQIARNLDWFPTFDWLGLNLGLINSPPSNDQFSQALDLGSSQNFGRTQSNFLATPEPGEPLLEGATPLHTVWFQWTPSVPGTMTFDTGEEDFQISLFTGSQLESLTEVVSGTSAITASVLEQQSYHIRISSPIPRAFILEGRLDLQPFTNNQFTNAITWSGPAHLGLGNADLCDFEENEPRPSGTSSSDGSVWWNWTPTQTGATDFAFAKGSFIFTIYRGNSLANLEQIITDRSPSNLRFHAFAGETYQLQLIARSQPGNRNLSFTLDQTLVTPSNDLFENPTLITGSVFDLEITPGPATFQEGEPSSLNESLWYQWQVPEDGTYLLKSTRGSASAYRGSSLDTLVEIPDINGETTIQGTAGEVLMIALNNQSSSKSTLSLSKIEGLQNDQFSNRIILGNVEQATTPVDLTYSTFEDSEPEILSSGNDDGSAWWQWTAPRDGLVSLSNDIYVFTGSSIDTLALLSQGSNAERFHAQAGMTYQFAVTYNHPFSPNYTFQLSMLELPNDQVTNPIIIPTELPFLWQGNITNATFERFEEGSYGGSAWWQWTAPRDGTILFESEPTLSVMQARSEVLELPRSTSNLPTGSVEVLQGETYLFRLLSNSFRPSSFSITWENPVLQTNLNFQTPLPIETTNVPISLPNRFDQLSATHWYQWTSSTGGTLTFNSENTTSFSATLYQGNPPDDLQPVTGFGRFPWDRFPVVEGQNYLIGIRYNSIVPASWTPSLGPPNDSFAHALVLPSLPTVVKNGDTTGSGPETYEAAILRETPGRTVWYSWIAPNTGTSCFANDQYRSAVFTGDQAGGLTVIAEGHAASFPTIAGTKYHLSVDGGSSEGTFQLTINPVVSRYETWRAIHFGESITASGKPGADPDNDGRTNLIELALGSNPLAFDQNLPLTITSQPDSLIITLTRPEGIEGTELSFEFSEDLETWQPTSDLGQESQTIETNNGQETYQMVVSDIPARSSKYFVRLKAQVASEAQ